MLPEQRNFEEAFKLSLAIALEKLKDVSCIKTLAENAGGKIKPDEEKVIQLGYLNKFVEVSWPDISVYPELPPREKLLILHYLVQCTYLSSRDLTTGKLISYQELPAGLIYFPVFMKRAITPLEKYFSKKAGTLTKAGEILGGIRASYGDESITIKALPRVPVSFILWFGDEEFEPAGNILFDASIIKYLPEEDVTILSEVLTWTLVKIVM